MGSLNTSASSCQVLIHCPLGIRRLRTQLEQDTVTVTGKLPSTAIPEVSNEIVVYGHGEKLRPPH